MYGWDLMLGVHSTLGDIIHKNLGTNRVSLVLTLSVSGERGFGHCPYPNSDLKHSSFLHSVFLEHSKLSPRSFRHRPVSSGPCDPVRPFPRLSLKDPLWQTWSFTSRVSVWSVPQPSQTFILIEDDLPIIGKKGSHGSGMSFQMTRNKVHLQRRTHTHVCAHKHYNICLILLSHRHTFLLFRTPKS